MVVATDRRLCRQSALASTWVAAGLTDNAALWQADLATARAWLAWLPCPTQLRHRGWGLCACVLVRLVALVRLCSWWRLRACVLGGACVLACLRACVLGGACALVALVSRWLGLWLVGGRFGVVRVLGRVLVLGLVGCR